MSKVYEIVQEKIVKEIEEAIKNGGAAPWKKPWKGGIPKNYITKRPYRGINLLLLEGGSYLTFKQIQDLQKKNPKVKLKKGSKSHMVVFWSYINRQVVDDEEDIEAIEVRDTPIFRYYRVFHVSDVEGIEDDSLIYDNVPIEQAEQLVDAYKEQVTIEIKGGCDRAYYNPVLDKIVVPSIRQFENVVEYYSTLFHEMIHSTGHKSRLNRFSENEGASLFGSESYSKEELVAEIGSNMLLSMLGIEDRVQQENSISYLYGWLQAIKNDPKLITYAAQRAQKACDYILQFQKEVALV
jgi:antirestriction protein ArdC